MSGHESSGAPESFEVRVLRQDGPGRSSYWQRFRVPYEPDMNVISVLQRVAMQSESADGKAVAPVAGGESTEIGISHVFR
jgi:succinate dehydrogenase / fumarate reductase iron-sulfur subunit